MNDTGNCEKNTFVNLKKFFFFHVYDKLKFRSRCCTSELQFCGFLEKQMNVKGLAVCQYLMYFVSIQFESLLNK